MRGRTAIVGAGAWGTALAIHAVRAGLAPRLWVRSADLLGELRADRENRWYLPGVPVPPAVTVVGSLPEALSGADLVLMAIPSHAFREVSTALVPYLAPQARVVSAAKGIEEARLCRMSEVLAEVLPPAAAARVAVLSGPTFALEVAREQPTAAVLAARDAALAEELQVALATPALRLYTGTDVVGVELGGALKNVLAIAAGISDGLGLGDNARAALLTRGLAEITRLGVALGARARTFAGLAGIGDLVLTCTGQLSRNRSLGLALGRGQSVAAWQAATRSVAEGVRTARAARQLAARVAVAAPIIGEVAAVVFEGKAPWAALRSLLARDPRPEEDVVDGRG